jgi:hypothetical protein
MKHLVILTVTGLRTGKEKEISLTYLVYSLKSKNTLSVLHTCFCPQLPPPITNPSSTFMSQLNTGPSLTFPV